MLRFLSSKADPDLKSGEGAKTLRQDHSALSNFAQLSLLCLDVANPHMALHQLQDYLEFM